MNKKFFLIIVVALCFVSLCQAEYLSSFDYDSINSYEAIMGYLSPYIGINLETIATLTGGIIPNRYSATIYSEDGEYSTGRIGEYFGPVSIIWKSDRYPIPLLYGATIGMKRSDVEGLFALMKESNSTVQFMYADNITSFVVSGSYQNTRMQVTINLVFFEDTLSRAELFLNECMEETTK